MPNKLLAFLALQREPTERVIVAGTLWPDVRDARAAANLRTILWRISRFNDELIVSSGSTLSLHPSVEVDYKRDEQLARTVLTDQPLAALEADFRAGCVSGPAVLQTEELLQTIGRVIQILTSELLSHWYDDWLELHQERWRQLRLHALDRLSVQLAKAGYGAAAVDAATAAVAAEPLRESGYRSLMVAHMAEGNVSEALLTHERYRALLERELGIAPSPQMCELLSETTGTLPASVIGVVRGRSMAVRHGRVAHFGEPSTPMVAAD